MTRESIIEAIKRDKIVSILRGVPKDKLIRTIEAIHEGGVNAVEITLDHTSESAIANSLDCITLAREHFGDEVAIGAGTVIDEDDAVRVSNAGALFVVSPNADERAIKKTRTLGMVSLPGAYTPTEICAAYRWGADFVKVFPLEKATAASYIKSLKGPLAHIPLIAVGGVSPDNLDEVMSAGACGVGIGRNIAGAFVKDYDGDDFKKITASAKAFTDILKKY